MADFAGTLRENRIRHAHTHLLALSQKWPNASHALARGESSETHRFVRWGPGESVKLEEYRDRMINLVPPEFFVYDSNFLYDTDNENEPRVSLNSSEACDAWWHCAVCNPFELDSVLGNIRDIEWNGNRWRGRFAVTSMYFNRSTPNSVPLSGVGFEDDWVEAVRLMWSVVVSPAALGQGVHDLRRLHWSEPFWIRKLYSLFSPKILSWSGFHATCIPVNVFTGLAMILERESTEGETIKASDIASLAPVTRGKWPDASTDRGKRFVHGPLKGTLTSLCKAIGQNRKTVHKNNGRGGYLICSVNSHLYEAWFVDENRLRDAAGRQPPKEASPQKDT